MRSARSIRCVLSALGLSWFCGIAGAVDLATLEARIQWNAPAFRTAIVCDQPGRPTVTLPEVITQKVQESFRTNGLVYYQGSLSYSERDTVSASLNAVLSALNRAALSSARAA